jgi:hypothetical protein
MDARELRIGNLVKSLKDTRGRKSDGTEEVLSIRWHSINSWQDMGASSSTSEEDIEGIPLTEEWLLKFGFEKTDLKPYKDQLAWVIGVDAARFIWSANRIFKPFPDGFICVCNHCEYVHQLQNYYFASENTELKY